MKQLALVALLGAPSVLAAQVTTLSSYVAADGAVRGAPALLGLTIGREAGHLGVRLGAGVDARSTLSWSDRTAVDGVAGLLTTEVDGLLFAGDPAAGHAVNAYLLAGAGMRMVRDDLAAETKGTWSYGVGIRAPVSARLALDGEARFRTPIGGDAGARAEEGWELRAGVHLRMGRRRSRPILPAIAPRTLPAPAAALTLPALESAATARARVAARALDTADDLLGTRYTWGGNSPAEGFDCSGFVRYVFRAQGIDLPRVSRDQARAGAPLPLDVDSFQPGDLIAFASDGETIDHIAIYAGEGRIIHSSSSGRGVRFDDLRGARGGWYQRHMVSARRVIDVPFHPSAQR